MQYIIKQVGRDRYFTKRGESSVANDDVFFGDKDEALYHEFFDEAMNDLYHCINNWGIHCVMVEVE